MNIRGLPSYVRQFDNKDLQQSLIFTYPILIDESLQKYAPVIRQFFSISFLLQIKTANILNITTAAVNMNTSSERGSNPALDLLSRVQKSSPNRTEVDFYDSYYGQSRQTEKLEQYQTFINRQLNFIRALIKSDKSYSKLSPIISSITVDTNVGMLTVPMIVGTFPYYTQMNSLYWILAIALGFGKRLDSISNLTSVLDMLPGINPISYYYLIFTHEGQQKLKSITSLIIDKPASSVDKLKSYITLDNIAKITKLFKSGSLGDKLDAFVSDKKQSLLTYGTDLYNKFTGATSTSTLPTPNLNMKFILDYKRNRLVDVNSAEMLKKYILDDSQRTAIFMRIALNESQWNRYVGVSADQNGMTSEFFRISPELESSVRDAQSVYSQLVRKFVTTIVFNFANNLEMLTQKNTTDLNKLVRAFVDSVSNISDSSYLDLWKEVEGYVSEAFYSGDNERINGISRIVKIVTNNEHDIMSSLSEVLSTISEINPTSDIKSYVKFNNVISTHSETLRNYANDILDDMKSVFGDKHYHIISDIITTFKNKISSDIYDLFFTENVYGSLMGDKSTLRLYIDQTNMYTNIAGSNAQKAIDNFGKLTNEMFEFLKSLLLFLYVFTFVSFLKGVIENVTISYNTMKRDATDFPNYCMVLPYYLFAGFYNILATKAFKTIIDDPNKLSDLNLDLGNIKVNQQQTKKIVDEICNRLAIPNVIVINEEKNEIIYKFMFMTKSESIKLDTINTYVKNQEDILLVS